MKLKEQDPRQSASPAFRVQMIRSFRCQSADPQNSASANERVRNPHITDSQNPPVLSKPLIHL